MTAPVLSLADCGVAVPAWLVRMLPAVASAALVGVMAADGAPPALIVIGVLLATASALSPGSAAPAALAGTAALVSAVYTSGGQLRPTLLALIFLVHLLHVSCGVAAVVPRKARLHLSALRRTAVRFVLVQASVLALVGLAYVLPGGRNPWHLEVIATACVAALVGLALVLLRRR